MPHRFTAEHDQFIRDNAKGITSFKLTELFNNRFNLSLNRSQIAAYMKNNKITNGLNLKFHNGHVPVNKGTRGMFHGGVETQFKKGQKPHNYNPIGTERLNGEGYIDIKVADPNKWKAKHLIIYESHYGPVPKGYAVIFGDGDKQNIDIENLILVSRNQLLQLNRKNLIQKSAELTKAAILVTDINIKLYKKAKNHER